MIASSLYDLLLTNSALTFAKAYLPKSVSSVAYNNVRTNTHKTKQTNIQ
ncbi:hypothetical protein GW750_04610 [bacterium]|nr:hypothetical protein [bacterium]